MKRLLISLMVLTFSWTLFSQVPDSVMTERIDKLHNQIMALKKNSRSLSYRIGSLKKAHQQDLDRLQEEHKAISEQYLQLEVDIEELTEIVTANQAANQAEMEKMDQWVRKGFLWLAILFAVLIVISLILIFMFRSQSKKSDVKLEARMLNIQEAIELELKELKEKHGEDLQSVEKRLKDLEKGEDKLKKK